MQPVNLLVSSLRVLLESGVGECCDQLCLHVLADEQYLLRRLADASIDIYGMGAVLSR